MESKVVSNKILTRVIFLCALVCMVLAVPVYAADPMVAELSKAKLPPITEPDIKVTRLSNGATVYYLKNAELPLFKMEADFEFGSIYDSEAERGLAGFFVGGWGSGGAKGMTAKEIDEKMEF